MRLNPDQREAILQTSAEVFGPDAAVWLFGSRVDDSKRGGDIDLLIRPGHALKEPVLSLKLSVLGKLEQRLGERKIDVVIEEPGDSRPIVRVAHETGIKL
jgi:predicted nucleotidyltransferase